MMKQVSKKTKKLKESYLRVCYGLTDQNIFFGKTCDEGRVPSHRRDVSCTMQCFTAKLASFADLSISYDYAFSSKYTICNIWRHNLDLYQ